MRTLLTNTGPILSETKRQFQPRQVSTFVMTRTRGRLRALSSSQVHLRSRAQQPGNQYKLVKPFITPASSIKHAMELHETICIVQPSADLTGLAHSSLQTDTRRRKAPATGYWVMCCGLRARWLNLEHILVIHLWLRPIKLTEGKKRCSDR
jgi:hypothetical protein